MGEELTQQEKAEIAEEYCAEVTRAIHRQQRAFDRYREAVEEMDGIKAVVSRDGGRSYVAHGDDKVAGILESLQASIDNYASAMHQCEAAVEEFERSLDRMGNQQHARILSLRFVSLMDWEDVATQVPYSYNHLSTWVKRTALASLYEVMPRKYR